MRTSRPPDVDDAVLALYQHVPGSVGRILGCISAAQRLHTGRVSVVCRLYIGCVSAVYRSYTDCVSVMYRPCIGFASSHPVCLQGVGLWCDAWVCNNSNNSHNKGAEIFTGHSGI